MRGDVKQQGSMLSLVQPAQRVPMDHPIRRIKAIADAELEGLAPVFDEMYSGMGRPSLPPEVLLKACLLIALFTVRSERQFCERLDYDLMFRFFLDMGMDEPSFDATTFTKNKKRLLEADVARLFFEGVVRQAKDARLISAEHFTVDGTLIEAWASTKSFKKKGARDTKPPDDPGNPTVNFHGEKRSNETHESTTDPEAKLARKGSNQAAKLSYAAHVLMENRNGLCRMGWGARDARPREEARHQTEHPGSRRWLRRAALRGRRPRTRRHTSHRSDTRQATCVPRRRAHDAAPRLCREPAETKTRRGDIRLDEDRRWIPEDPLPR
jgi:transposase